MSISMNVSRTAILIGAALMAASSAAGVADPKQTPAMRRAVELAEAIRTNDPKTLFAYVNGAFTPDASGVGAYLGEAQYRVGSITDINATADSPNSAKLVFRTQYSRQLSALVITVEDQPPYRIKFVAPQPPPEEKWNIPSTDAGRIKAIDSLAARLHQAGIFDGVVLVAKNGIPIYQRAFGYADRVFKIPNAIDTKFHIGSMNKMFTAIAIGQLVDAGKVSLEDPLVKYVPDFIDTESATKVKLKHLLSHTSGLGDYFNEEFYRSPPGRFRGMKDYFEVAKTNAKLSFEPGTGFYYSNTGMLLAGRIVEIAAGMDYYDYVQKNIYGPVGMRDTDSFDSDSIIPKRANGYEVQITAKGRELRDAILSAPARGSPAGGGYATAPDLLRLANALQAGKLLRPATLALFTAPRPESKAPDFGYGFIKALRGPAGRNITGHGGDYNDGTCANLAIIRDAGTPYTAIVLSNGTIVGSCHSLVKFMNAMFPAKI